MGDRLMQDVHYLRVPDNKNVLALAVKALEIIATQRKSDAGSNLDLSLEDFCKAFVSTDDRQWHLAVSRLIAGGVTSEEILDDYVPSAARRIGELWVDDELTFAEVTVGAARMQEFVRGFGKRGNGVNATIPLGRSILLAVPSNENHVLGAFVAATQFRRCGLWVHMAIGQSPLEIAQSVNDHSFSMVGISAASRRSLDPLRELVTTIRTECGSNAPIVIGGNVGSLDLDVEDYTGADLVTMNPRSALEFCGISLVRTVTDAREATA